MAKTTEVLDFLNKFAPLESAQHWDNSGWQVNFGNPEVNKIMAALTVTEDVVQQAIDANCDFILSHHPVFFEPIKKIAEKHILEAIKHRIQIYSMHTNLDIALGGTSDMLAQKLGFQSVQIYNDFVRTASYEDYVPLDGLIQKVKEQFALDSLKVINNNKVEKVKTVAFCAGSGGNFISALKNSKIDLYVTGDVKYHDAIEAENLVVFDVGHFESEKYVADIFKNVLRETGVEVVAAKEENIWHIV